MIGRSTVLFVLLALTSCVGAEANGAAPAERPASAAADVTVVVSSDDGRSQDASEVRAAVATANTYFKSKFGVGVQGTVTVELRSSSLPYAEFVAGMASGHAQGGVITIFPSGRSTSSRGRLGLIAHELFHILQGQVGWRGPTWLREGAAEFVSNRVLIDGGLLDSQQAKRAQGLVGTPPPALRSLPALENCVARPGQACYSLYFLAVETLADGDLTSLRRYWEALAYRWDWETAFEDAFGTSEEAFSVHFERIRADLGAPSIAEPILTYPDHVDAPPADVTIESVRSPVMRGENATLLASTTPSARCSLIFVSALGRAIHLKPATAGDDGRVTWIWPTSAGLASGTATAQVGCGNEVQLAEIALR